MPSFLSYVDSGRFEELFEELGWGYVPRGVSPITVQVEEGRPFTARPVADQAGLRVWVVEADELPTPTEQRIIDAEVQKVSQLRLLIFTDGTHQSWRWPRRGATAATNAKLLHHRYTVGDEDLAEDLSRRLAMIELPIGETIGILEIQERMASAFNDEAVKRSKQASSHMQVMNQQLLDAGCDTSTASSLLVRLLFLFFGDDTNMWPDDTFQKWVLHHTTAETLSEKLTELFEVVCDPELDLAISGKGRYAGTEYANFRRIDGMYRERIDLPPVPEEFRQQVLKAGEFDWGRVNPDIFGAMFQQLVDLEELGENGEHYTSEENIMRVVGPLFLEDLRNEFEASFDDRGALLNLQTRMSKMVFLDPACGCGNFLIQAYKHLRGLEFEIITRAEELELAEINEALDRHARGERVAGVRVMQERLQEIESRNAMQFADVALLKSKLSMQQFFGIEVNEWPAKVASTAMLLVDHLCNQVWGESVVRLPVEQTPEISNANALESDWGSLIGADFGEAFIIGNPPFRGAKRQTPKQKAELLNLFKGVRLASSLDYVAAWFFKASEMMANDSRIRTGLVSTSSICQGQQAFPIWNTLQSRFGVKIEFAWKPFLWETESENRASVFVTALGLTVRPPIARRLFSGENTELVENISPYLVDGPDTVVSAASVPLSPGVPECDYGSLINDGGHLILSDDEMDSLLSRDPSAEEFVRPLIGSQEFIKGTCRHVLYLKGVPASEIRRHAEINERVDKVRETRLKSTAKATRDKANRPQEFYYDSTSSKPFLVLPSTTTQRRQYIPIGMCSPEVVATNSVAIVPGADLYVFGVLSSLAHNAWMRRVAGRMKEDYRYSPKTVYNTFPWPNPSLDQRKEIEAAAREVLKIRNLLQPRTLEQLYSPGAMPEQLLTAHRKLDEAVSAAYGMTSNGYSEDRIVGELLRRYECIVQ